MIGGHAPQALPRLLLNRAIHEGLSGQYDLAVATLGTVPPYLVVQELTTRADNDPVARELLSRYERNASPTSADLPCYRNHHGAKGAWLSDPTNFLADIHDAQIKGVLRFDYPPDMWGLVAAATLARVDGPNPLKVEFNSVSHTTAFARAVGFDDVIRGEKVGGRPEVNRTVKLTRITDKVNIDDLAKDIATLITQQNEADPSLLESRKVIKYVITELLRNVVQHSCDKLGGIVAAQRMDEGHGYVNGPSLQVAVADNGIGIQKSLNFFDYHNAETPRAALDMALWPHLSGTFAPARRGTEENAGLGLFFLSEFAKLTGGRLMLASRGAALTVTGKEDDRVAFLPEGIDYPGTLAVFEAPLKIESYTQLIERVQQLAADRHPTRHGKRWMTFLDEGEQAPVAKTAKTVASLAIHDRRYGQVLLTKVVAGIALELNFVNVDVLSQSTAHSLLFSALQKAEETKVPIFIRNACPAVRSSLRFLQLYALG
jgi:hypothetical protein